MISVFIFLNALVFLAWNFSGRGEPPFLVDNFLVSWTALQDGRWWTLVTSVFSHASLLHFLLNMFVLNSFGGIMVRVLGHRRFLIFYFAAGIISSFCHAAVSRFLLDRPDLPALGASGAIAGLVLLFSLVFPREKILIFGIIPLPALFGALVFVGLDIWGLIAQAEGGGLPIGHGAHLGGAATGILYYFLVLRRQRLIRPYL